MSEGDAGEGVLAGFTFALSGTLSVPRGDFENLIKSNGGATASSVTGKVTHLVSTEQEVSTGTTKTMAAAEKGIPIVSELFVQDAIKYGAPPTDLSAYLIGASGDEEYEPAEEEDEPKRKTTKKATLEEADASSSVDRSKCLAGYGFCLTGTLSKPRKQIEELIQKHGGKVASSVTNAVNFLLCSEAEFEEGSNKIEAALSKDISINNEKFLNDWLESGVKPKETRPRYLLGDDAFAEDEEDEEAGEGEEDAEEEAEENEEDEEDEDEVEDDDDDEGEEEGDDAVYYDDEVQAIVDLDPKLAPYDGPCLWDRFPNEQFQHIFQFLTIKEILNLWKTGSKSLRQKLRLAHLPSLSLRFRNPLKLNWPLCVMYFRNVAAWSISAPEGYEHMPIQGFSPSDFPGSVKKLRLGFGNACELLTKISIGDTLPNLNTLEIRGQQIDPHFLTLSAADEPPKGTVAMKMIRTLEVLDLEHVKVKANDLTQLPRDLKIIRGLVIDPRSQPPPAEIWHAVMPHSIHTLHVTAGVHAGFVIAQLKFSRNIRSLHVQGTIPSKPVGHYPLKDSNFLEDLPECVTDLQLDIANEKGEVWSAGGAQPSDSLLTASLFPKLLVRMKALTSLVVKAWPWRLNPAELKQYPEELTTLRLPDLEPVADLSWMFVLPPSITDLRLWSLEPQGAATIFKAETFLHLPPDLKRLALNFDGNIASTEYAKLPRSVTDLQVHQVNQEEEDMTKAVFPPNLKRFTWYCDYSFLYIPLKWMPPTLESFVCLGDCDWEGDDLDWPPNLKQFVASSSNFDGEIFEKAPKKLRSFIMPREGDSSHGEWFESLPRGLRRLHWYLTNSMDIDADQMKALPKRLVSLKLGVQHLERSVIKKVPKTLKELIISEYDEGEEGEVPIKKIKRLLPPQCRLIVKKKSEGEDYTQEELDQF